MNKNDYQLPLEEVKKELSNHQDVENALCGNCNQDWYCPTPCETVKRSRKISMDRIQKNYSKSGGDMVKLFKFINTAKLDSELKRKSTCKKSLLVELSEITG